LRLLWLTQPVADALLQSRRHRHIAHRIAERRRKLPRSCASRVHDAQRLKCSIISRLLSVSNSLSMYESSFARNFWHACSPNPI
jgi:hypothetical protein